MEWKYKEQLRNAGVDLQTALDRFMNNEALYTKILFKFPLDNSFNNLKEQLTQNNIQEAFAAAHTLKGICGNLSLTCLTDIIYPMADKLKSGQIDGMDEMMDNLEKHYLEICSIIKRMQ